MTDTNSNEKTDEERIEAIDEACKTIREAAGVIKINVEGLDGRDVGVENETLQQLWDWSDDMSAKTYQWSDEDGWNFRYR